LCIRFWPQLQGLPLRYVKLHTASSGMWVANPKIKEDSGIHDLKVKNRALLGKWRFKLLTEDRVRKTLLNRKYLPKCFVQSFLDPWDSHLLAGLMATKKYFFPYGSFIIKDGSKIRIWEDKWLGTTTLRKQHRVLYNIVCHKGTTITRILESSP
jgi:hypothetical protein